jgi:biotin carboxyl carrier protein
MPGKVVSVNVNIGEAVTKGQRLMVLEAMKMETPMPSPCDGTVKEVRAVAGARVNAGDVLMVVE